MHQVVFANFLTPIFFEHTASISVCISPDFYVICSDYVFECVCVCVGVWEGDVSCCPVDSFLKKQHLLLSFVVNTWSANVVSSLCSSVFHFKYSHTFLFSPYT